MLLWAAASSSGFAQYYGGPRWQRLETPVGQREPEVDHAVAKQGFLFVDGEYLSLPYELRVEDDRVLANGRELKSRLPEYSISAPLGLGPGWPGGRGLGGGEDARGRRAGSDGTDRGSARRQNDARRQVGMLQRQLDANCAVISFADQPLVVLDNGSGTYDLLSAVTGQLKPMRPVSLSEKLPQDLDPDVWGDWLSNFKPSDELRARAAEFIARFDAREEEAQASIAAKRRLESLAYPVTVGGMVLAVLALGHLLGGRPHAGRSTLGRDTSPETVRGLYWSLALIALLSAFDLVWTILFGQAGEMHELNPLGTHLIDDPRHLAGFKFGIMLPVIGLFWLLRHHKRVQVAAWWTCLILTVLAFRWLAFHSLYVEA